MKIGVIGATGMIGHHTAKAVLERGHELTVIHRKNSKLSLLNDLSFEAAEADLSDEAALTKAFAGLDAIIHCAAYYPSEPRPLKEDVRLARLQMDTFLSACEAAKGLKKIVYTGGSIALPKALDGSHGTEELTYRSAPSIKNAYLHVKYEMDKMARERASENLPIVIGIPVMCFGEYDYGPSTGQLIAEVANETLPAYLEGKRNVVYTGDAGRGLVLAAEKGRIGERYLFAGSNIAMSVLVPKIAMLAGVKPPRVILPLPAAKIIASFLSAKQRLLGGPSPKLSKTAVAVMGLGQFINGSKAQRELGYSPSLTLDETLERTLDWFVQEGYIKDKGEGTS
ncbi:NAD-dependent epimerase/dehydratase family protein [Bacillus sp. FJAT-42376]|uniref:NAD-dependent epimerase/dehydratase family protein n=1 Tax=Bacillus sp. FJAT-42376 TaxID=2014076 RepID=UPI000F4E92DB|nr:NAD-dependent epimerase/dehydratase family protein [Bacillus sp. FJAT-42376]AZB42152.1 NAD-dependent epimerase/dehydratase family protein [Bacillus sp. FJAT-42376]